MPSEFISFLFGGLFFGVAITVTNYKYGWLPVEKKQAK